jgi:hypothetical protein
MSLSEKTDTSGNHIKEINGWTIRGQTQMSICLHRLKYNRIINNFFIHELKKKEGSLSWHIIVVSSFASVLSLANTNKDLFPYSSIIIQTLLILFSLITTLLGAYIKKQKFVERINDVDRYLQLLNKTVEELNITFILEPEKRLTYDDFCKKYIPLIQELSVVPDSFSPKEWKRIVYTITKYHPELISVDGSDQEKLWPLYEISFDETPRIRSEFAINTLIPNSNRSFLNFLSCNICNSDRELLENLYQEWCREQYKTEFNKKNLHKIDDSKKDEDHDKKHNDKNDISKTVESKSDIEANINNTNL